MTIQRSHFQCAWWEHNTLIVSPPNNPTQRGIWFGAFSTGNPNQEDDSGANVLLNQADVFRLHKVLTDWLAKQP